ncbi:transcriptional regulator [Alicyclobacillus contaminans]|uniref:ArsR/SmtB family transcription factor n=1 Tax=Alicyclobacillus contaminans TaxID=392016 RepID=UPI00040A71C7|nr:metalloregulator ArsR/SmtB family transcription factor [Alicyclobacillus contaminans]GMA49645.1 transcriptional regulator [Alicyclobacillus contaminans]
MAARHDVFHAIADPTRRRMMQLLAEQEMSVAAMVDCFPISRSAVAKHLQILTDAGLVRCRRVGREARYQLQPEPLSWVADWLSYFERYWDNKLALLKQTVEQGPSTAFPSSRTDSASES